MTVVLVVAPAKPVDGDTGRPGDRRGDLFDTALVDVVRTLDGPGDGTTVLVPWTDDLADLVVAATVDGVSATDLEADDRSGRTRSRLVPYLVPGEDAPDAESALWQASHLTLGGVEVAPLASAVRAAPPTHVLVLGLPADRVAFRDALGGLQPAVLTFSQLASAGEAADLTGVPADRVVDLPSEFAAAAEPASEPGTPESAILRMYEAGLEPFVPFGLLVQAQLDEALGGED